MTTRITLDAANKVISAALAHAARTPLKPLAVAVLDGGGHLVAYQRQDGASSGRLQIACGKAAGALFLGMSSRKIAIMAVDRASFVSSLTNLAPQGLVPAPGGLIVVNENAEPIGAVGISGDTSDNDEACAHFAIAQAGLLAGE